MILKTVFITLIASVTLLTEIFFQKIVSNIYLSIGLVCFFLGILVAILRYVEATLKESAEFLLTFAFLFIYQLCRYSVSAIRPQIMSIFFLTPSEFASFTSCFSLGYAAVQVIAGYIISKWGFRGLGSLNILAGIALISTTIPTTYSIVLVMRTITGICFSAGALGFICSVNNISKKHFNLLFSMGFFIALKMASMTNFFIEQKVQNSTFLWTTLYRILGKFAIVIGIGIFLLSFYSNSKIESKNQTNLIKNVKSFFSDIDMVLLSIFSALIVAPTYVFQNGWLNSFDVYMNKPIGTCTKFFNDSTAYANICVPAIVAARGTRSTMLISSILATLGTFILFTFTKLPYQLIFMIIAAVYIGIGFASHSVPNIAITEKFSDERVPIYFAIMNFICMIVGSSIMQKLSGWILDGKFPKNRLMTGKKMVSGLSSLLWFLCFCTIGALISISIFYIRNRKTGSTDHKKGL